jgi:regulator of PEP synthase PpsR (kinase-PPPase family)
MVSGGFKEQVDAYCRHADLPCVDLTGHVVQFLTEVTGAKPSGDRHSLHRVDQAYQRRIGAIEYTLAHDDGLGLDTLADADVVLTGVSRTSKTPTSMYLAQQGYRVANVALAIEVEPPSQLLALTRKQVVGLIVDPHQLVMIRKRREVDWRMSDQSYGDPGHVARELAWARRLFMRQGWPVLDVTDSAIEETAARVIRLLGRSPAG